MNLLKRLICTLVGHKEMTIDYSVAMADLFRFKRYVLAAFPDAKEIERTYIICLRCGRVRK